MRGDANNEWTRCSSAPYRETRGTVTPACRNDFLLESERTSQTSREWISCREREENLDVSRIALLESERTSLRDRKDIEYVLKMILHLRARGHRRGLGNGSL